jgi:hypothetical protein
VSLSEKKDIIRVISKRMRSRRVLIKSNKNCRKKGGEKELEYQKNKLYNN